MLHLTRPAALAAVAALALAATACATRQTTTDSQTTWPSAAQPSSTVTPASPSRPGEPAVTARSLPAEPSAPRGTAPVQPGASVTLTGPDGAPVALSDIFFEFDESALSSNARRTLDQNAEYLRRNAGVRLQIEGHADERGSTAYNLALGDRRATAARRYLESLGIGPSRISTISFGEERPFVLGSSEDAWAQNRRGHFVEVR